jgi:plastocyanin
MSEFQRRVLVPLVVPLLAAGLIGMIVLNYSRTLLALKGAPAVVVALLTALAVLGGATWFSRRSDRDSTPAVATLALAGLLVVGAGFVGLARLDEEHSPARKAAAGAVQKPGPPDVTIHAYDIGFREKRVTAPAGQLKIAEVDEGQITHTLLLDGVPGFKLVVAGKGQEAQATVTLQPGEYTYYCDVPGHRQAGMQGTLVVTPGSGVQAAGAAFGSSLEVKAGDLFLDPKQARVPAGPVRITYRNTGSLEHTLVAEGQPQFQKLVVEPGQEKTGVLDVGPGTYTLYCDIPGHRAAGMQITLVVG